MSMMVCLACALFLQQDPGPAKQFANPLDPIAFGAALKSAFAGADEDFVIAPNLSHVVDAYWAKQPDPYRRFIALSAQCSAQIVEIGGCNVSNVGAARSTSASQILSSWISKLSADELRQVMTATGGQLETLVRSQPMQEFLCAIGAPAQMVPGFVTDAQESRVRTRIRIRLEVRDKEGRVHTVLVDPTYSQIWSSLSVPKDRHVPLARPATDGPILDYSQGRFAKAKEILKEASSAFKRDYKADARLIETYQFWQGKFDMARFEKIAASVLFARNFQATEPEAAPSLADLLSGPLASLVDDFIVKSGLPDGEALKQGFARAGDLAKSFPELKNLMDQLGLANDASIGIHTELVLSFAAPGLAEPMQPSSGRPAENGLPSPATGVANSFSIVIGG